MEATCVKSIWLNPNLAYIVPEVLVKRDRALSLSGSWYISKATTVPSELLLMGWKKDYERLRRVSLPDVKHLDYQRQ
jgi:hypothetical protein